MEGSSKKTDKKITSSKVGPEKQVLAPFFGPGDKTFVETFCQNIQQKLVPKILSHVTGKQKGGYTKKINEQVTGSNIGPGKQVLPL